MQNRVASMGERRITPDRFRLVALNQPRLKAVLGADAEIELPAPDGSMRRYRFTPADVMAPALAAQFPDIRTYNGVGVDDPRETVRFDWTPAGFHAMVLSPDGATYYIDPYQTRDVVNHMSYFRRDLTKKIGADTWTCGVNASYKVQQPQDEAQLRTELATIAQRSTDGKLRKYRLALAATGEYVAAVSPPSATTDAQKKAAALAAMVTTMHRVNGIYETEVGITMELISATTSLIFTRTDVYSNANGVAMLGQNQEVIDAVIGSANYDIGHVFSTGGGGIAFVGVPCADGYKAQGVTGLGAPVGDAFDVDYVSHEMGHQFGADHTFNSESGSCGGSPSNRSAGSAFEPGSGSTIMAYAGICTPEDLQPHSDPYFHTRSFDQILDYAVAGYGDTCAVKTSTANDAPVVDAGAVYTIPARTPFAMTGSATDANGDPMTYDWQEYDLGAATSSESTTTADDGSRPLFRVFNPTASGRRDFPRITTTLTGVPIYGEGMPKTSRTLNFRLVARDGRGGVSWGATHIETYDTGATFSVTAPTAGAAWATGSAKTVTWNVAGTSAAPISCSDMKIQQSRDGGYTWPFTLTASTPNDGSQVVTLRGAPTALGRIRVSCAASIFYNISAGMLDVATGPYLTSISPMRGLDLGGTKVVVVGANLNGATSARVGGIDVDFTQLSATQVQITVPAGIAGTVVSVSVQTSSGDAILDDSLTYIEAVVVSETERIVTTTNASVVFPPQIGDPLLVVVDAYTPTSTPRGTLLTGMRVYGEQSGTPVTQLSSSMTITLRYDASGTTPKLYAYMPTLRGNSMTRGAAAGWQKVPATVDTAARRVTAQATLMTDYVLVSAPGANVYVPVALRERTFGAVER